MAPNGAPFLRKFMEIKCPGSVFCNQFLLINNIRTFPE
jgi:hypothetical protein